MTFKTINVHKPISLVDNPTTPVKILGVRQNGELVVDSPDFHRPMVVTPEGLDLTGPVLKPLIQNVAVRSSGFYPYQQSRGFYGRGVIGLDMAKTDWPEAHGFVEVVTEDGKPVDMIFHAK